MILQKLKTELKKIYHNPHVIALSKGTTFRNRNANISKIKRALVLKDVFKNYICLYLRTKFQVPSIIQTSVRQKPTLN